ncbi:MAG: transposase [Chloroflexi bacterium]|nr:transposase [Chloroflexota bacterium]
MILDECGSNLNLTPRYARAPRGQRAVGHVPRNTPPNTTVIASLTLHGIGPSVRLSGATDGLAFETYLEQVLAPTLRAGQVVSLDNLSVHRSARVAKLIAARSCELSKPLPNSSRRCAASLPARSKCYYEVMGEALPTISLQDAAAFFLACGYPAPASRATSLRVRL